jgi:hypothetical protein
MPRANRYFLPGYVWHITHRCHKGEFLLKFDRDQRRWVQRKTWPKAMWREMAGANGSYELRETKAAYKAVLDGKNGSLRQKNGLFWNISIGISMS